MEALLDRAGDPDHKFLLQGESGYPVGVLHPLPRTPHMYEEQTSWKLEDDPYMKAEIWRNNYDSVGDHEEFVREHFAEECKEGLMEKLTLEQAHGMRGLVQRWQFPRLQSWWRNLMEIRNASSTMRHTGRR